MKPDEKSFMFYIFEFCDGNPQFIREYIKRQPIPKRYFYILSKWEKKNWYDYGVCLDLGWLTDKGKRFVSELTGIVT